MADLTVAEYDRAEQNAVLELSNRVVEAFQPVRFLQTGYPTRIRQESELFKYVDAMHELDFEGDFTRLLGGLTEEEFDIMQRLAESVNRFSLSRFGRKAAARSNLVSSLNVFRHIKYLFGESRPKVLEIGPGCGYLGAMLMLESYPYTATDITQAFYLYQNHLWNFVSQGKVVELAATNGPEDTMWDPAPGEVLHVPWWAFAKLEPDSTPSYDIITCNHVLCEMNLDSLGFTLNIAQSLLSNTERPMIVFEGWGCGQQLRRSVVNERLYRWGFGIVHNDPMITVLSPRASKLGKDCLPMPVQRPQILTRGRNAFRRITGRHPLEPYDPLQYVSESNPASMAILKARNSESRPVDLEIAQKFYRRLMGEENYLSPDEQFRVMAGHRG